MKTNTIIKRVIDVALTVTLLLLMAFQVTEQLAHEWLGVTMFVLTIVHQILNRRFYMTIFKGKYNALRVFQLIVNTLLLLSFVCTALSGMMMSRFATPFMNGLLPSSVVRQGHLAMSHWSFALMGLHLGLHFGIITSKLKNRTVRIILRIVMTGISVCGFYLFFKSDMLNYMLFKNPFAFLDYEKAWWLVILDNLAMIVAWAFAAYLLSLFLRLIIKKDKRKPALLYALLLIVVIVSGIVLNTVLNPQQTSATLSWSAPQNDPTQSESPTQSVSKDNKEISDNYILIKGGSFLMGSPESENWRGDDETQHEVTVADFYISPYEITQAEYHQVMGKNPSTFTGDDLPVDNISYIEALQFANKKSEIEGLNPVYTISNQTITWNRSANGYRLPTEAEWEYACRAGTTTPFNLEHSLGANEANFYGHYPYEIEENYFDNSALTAKPGEYRMTTVAVGSFTPNVWGLYDMHGNVNEWCFDIYGAYNTNDTDNPYGAESGTRHVYRGGGWNDFGKNMRSAYRAAGTADMRSYNLGVRLVRNAGESELSAVTVSDESVKGTSGGKVLIVYYSWSGNTRGVAQEIQKQTNADIFEIELVTPYSTDYNTVLMQAQEAQHHQDRPAIKGTIDNIDQYDTIILGYPNWWASIPMPIATFLEQYDLSGKIILPFCSHGGGRFGQSLTAIAKLAPNSNIGEGLSVHYSGGDTLSRDVASWLEATGIQ